MASGYSVDMLKRSAFVDEINNTLISVPVEEQDEDYLVVLGYLKKRIKEIEKHHGH